MPDIKTIRLGIANTYLVEAESGFVFVDCGVRNKEKKLARSLGRLGVAPDRIRLIVITHTHYDHAGSLAAIKKMCGCPVAVHDLEYDTLAQGRPSIPPGTNLIGRAVSWLGRMMEGVSFMNYTPVEAEIRVKGEFSLSEFGLAGRLVHTPGHTAGSMSLILDTGEAMIGDAAFNFLPLSLGSIRPPFAEDMSRVYDSWANLLEAGALCFYPGHGPPFPAERMQQEYKRGTRR
ncbi:MAG: MBL fold metallo-hydrolase [Thermodesulfobacteriota bacterium]|nr:MBL fold metallo-hydrolase [Thermodesulfobacteriota bacterium]